MNKLLASVIVSAFVAGIAIPVLADDKDTFPEFDRAIHTLESAKQDLQKAKGNFGGHRGNAIKQIDASIRELHQSIAYAKAHPEKK